MPWLFPDLKNFFPWPFPDLWQHCNCQHLTAFAYVLVSCWHPVSSLTPRAHHAGKIGNRRFHSQNASNAFSPHYAGEIWKRIYHRSFCFCVCWKLGQRNHAIIVTPSFSKSSILRCFMSTQTKSRRFQIFPGLKSVFEKLRFRDRLVWTVGLTDTVFSNSSGEMWTRP